MNELEIAETKKKYSETFIKLVDQKGKTIWGMLRGLHKNENDEYFYDLSIGDDKGDLYANELLPVNEWTIVKNPTSKFIETHTGVHLAYRTGQRQWKKGVVKGAWDITDIVSQNAHSKVFDFRAKVSNPVYQFKNSFNFKADINSEVAYKILYPNQVNRTIEAAIKYILSNKGVLSGLLNDSYSISVNYTNEVKYDWVLHFGIHPIGFYQEGVLYNFENKDFNQELLDYKKRYEPNLEVI